MLGDLKTPKTLIFCHFEKNFIWQKLARKKIKIKHRHTQKKNWGVYFVKKQRD
jgi:hypothetical protein